MLRPQHGDISLSLSQIAKFMGPTWGPPGSCRAQMGPMLAPRTLLSGTPFKLIHDDVIKWKHFPRYWPFVRGIHRSPMNSPHKGQWRGALMFSSICVWINGWVNSEAGDLGRHRGHNDVIVMIYTAVPAISSRVVNIIPLRSACSLWPACSLIPFIQLMPIRFWRMVYTL